MNIFLPILLLSSLAMAEPPVGDGYPEARSSPDHHHDHYENNSDQHSSLSQEYGPPSATSRNAFSAGYSAPNSRNAQNSRSHSPPTARVSFSQRFGSASRSNQGYAAAARSLSQEHTAPNARSGISQEYGAPNARSLSQEYGVPSIVSARTLSSEYGVLGARSSPSQEYGTPIVAARQKSPSQTFRSLQPKAFQANSFSHTSARSNAQGYDGKSFSRSTPSSTYGAPSSRSLSTSYSIPSARDSDSYSQEHNALSQTYGAPDQRDLSDTYGVPSARGLSQEYGAPSSRSNLKTDAIASSYASARTAPSSNYLPSGRDSMPSQQYGVPEDHNQGYDDVRARALEELLNQEPANYDFSYQIEDQESGGDFGHSESRLEDRAAGSYFVVLPDGTKQTVEYEADEGGFKPRISVEPVGGYDENAADISRSSGGPY